MFGALLDMLVPAERKRAAAADGWNIGPWYNSRAKTQSNVVVNEELALTLSACWCASRILSEGVSDRDLITYERTDQKDTSRQEAIGNPVYEMLRHFPNELMGSTAFRTGRTLHQVNMGNGFAEIERDMQTDEPIALWPIHPGRVRPVQPGDKYRDGQPIQMGSYLVRNNDGGNVVILAKDMLHMPGFHTEDGVWAKGVIAYARECMGLGIAGERQIGTNFGNGNTPRVVLIDPDLSDPEQRREFRENWKTMHGSPDSGEVAILWHRDAKLEPLTITPADAQFLELLDFNQNQIAKWYRVPPHMMADLKDSKYATVEALGLEFVIYSLFPLCKRQEEQYNLKLFTRDERKRFFVQHDFNGLLRGDLMARMNAYRTAIMIGVMTINECRRLENMNGIGDSGDKAMFPANMLTVDDVIAGKGAGGQPGSDHTGGPNDGMPGGLPMPRGADTAAMFDQWSKQLLKLDRQELYGRLDRIEQSLKADHRAASLPVVKKSGKKKRKARITAAKKIMVDALRRIFTREANNAQKASASSGDFDVWVESAYSKHRAYSVDALSPACEMASVLGFEADAEKLTDALIVESKSLLTVAYRDRTPEDFCAMVESWPTVRAAAEAEKVFACGGKGGTPGPCPEGKEPSKGDGKSGGKPLSAPTAKVVSKLQEDAKDKGEKAVTDFVNSDAWKGPKGEEGIAAVKEKLDAAYAKSEVTINASPLSVASMISDGKIKNTFEAGADDKGSGYAAAREKVENEVFGTSKDVPTADRPKYAAVNWEQNMYGAAPKYGDVTIVLNKDKLADRTTMVNGDTFGHYDSSGVATPEDPYHAMLGNAKAMAAAGIEGTPTTHAAAYNEQHVFGNLAMDKDSIKEIRMPSLTAGHSSTDDIVSFGEKNGIPVTFFHEQTGESVSYEQAKQWANGVKKSSENKGIWGSIKGLFGG